MFMKLLSFLIMSMFFFQCGGDNAVREQAKAEVEQMAKTTSGTATPASGNQETPSSPRNPIINETLTLVMGNGEVKAGEETCLPITATGFTDLIGLQFSIRWEREELEYVKVDKLELTDLGPQNFGDTHSELGVVALSWIHQSLRGVTLPADAHLFDICFTPKVKAGSKVDVRFEARPVAFEVINVKEELLQFSGENGQINVVD
jgi:hypothetical protein